MPAFKAYVSKLAKNDKPVIICGDLNVAHRDIDLARPKPNYNKSAGYMQEEIDGLDALIAAGFTDTYRHLHPAEREVQLVELPRRRTKQEHRLAYRLRPGQQRLRKEGEGSLHPERCPRQRPLPGRHRVG